MWGTTETKATRNDMPHLGGVDATMKMAPKISFGTKFQQGLDSAIGTVFPGLQLQRMQNRAKVAQLSTYAGAQSGRARRPPNSLRNPDSLGAQSDAHVMQRRSQDLGRDSAFIGHLNNQYRIYALGDVNYIPNTGDRKVNQLYRDFWQSWMKKADAQGRFHFIEMIQLALSGVFYNGRHGFIHHHNSDGTFQIQSVMGYNIGNPNTIYSNPHNIQGIAIDEAGRVVAYDIYRLGINGAVHFVQRVPAIIFTCFNPVTSSNEYSAKTPLHAVLNDAHDMREVEQAWMKKIQWASMKTAVFNTPNGSPPDVDPNDLDNYNVNSIARGKIIHQAWGEELHGEEGFAVEMLKNENPSNNETDFLGRKLAQVASALCLPLPFVDHLMGVGVPGTMTRLISAQAERAFQYGPYGQKWMERSGLDDIKKLALLSGINRGEIPYTKYWDKGEFMYPAHPTVDAGDDSKSSIDLNRAGLESMSSYTARQGKFWEDVDEQLADEALNKMMLADRVSNDFNAKTGQETTWRDSIDFISSLSPNPASPSQNQVNDQPASE